MTRWDQSRWPSQWGAGREPVRLPSLSTTALPDEEDWRYQAACAGVDTDLFFPVGVGPEARAQTAQAKAMCARCPVRADCLEFALDTDQQFGVWGGLAEEEREALKKHRSYRLTKEAS